MGRGGGEGEGDHGSYVHGTYGEREWDGWVGCGGGRGVVGGGWRLCCGRWGEFGREEG